MAKKQKNPRRIELTGKQRGAALSFIETGSKAEAFRRNYSHNFNNHVIAVKAHELFELPHVKEFVEELQAEQREKLGVSLETLTVDLESDRQLAYKEGQAASAVSATMGKAKIHGYLIERQERKTTLEVIDKKSIAADIEKQFEDE